MLVNLTVPSGESPPPCARGAADLSRGGRRWGGILRAKRRKLALSKRGVEPDRDAGRSVVALAEAAGVLDATGN